MNMRNGKVQFVLVTMLLVVMGIWLFPPMTEGKQKDTSWQSPEDERDGYSQSFVLNANGPLIEVPEGKCYVLLMLYSKYVDYDLPYFDNWGEGEGDSAWTLTIDGELFLDEFSLYGHSAAAANMCCVLREDFPDKCVVVRGGEMLAITKHENVDALSITLIGYFCDAP